MFKKQVVLGAVIAAMAVAAPANAQSCNGTNSCFVTTTASVNVPALVDLTVAGAGSIALTAPTAADFATGYVQDAGPSITVKANRAWSLSIHTTAASNWTYVSGGQSGLKPISDLEWSTTSSGTYTAITNSAAAMVSNQAATDAGAPTVFFRTLYAASFASARNASGVYSIPLVFTLSAP